MNKHPILTTAAPAWLLTLALMTPVATGVADEAAPPPASGSEAPAMSEGDAIREGVPDNESADPSTNGEADDTSIGSEAGETSDSEPAESTVEAAEETADEADPAGPAVTDDAPAPADDADDATPDDPAAAEADEEPANEEPVTESLPLNDLRVFAEVFGRIKSDYVEQISDRDLLAGAIRGMLAGLDPHSSYLDPESYRDLQVGTTGEFGGLGIEVGMEDGFVKVIAPIDDTPASRAGMQAGDLIIRIDEKPVKGMSLNDAVTLMRGKPGSPIKLTVVREGEGNPLTVELTRDVIKVASVRSRTLEPGFGYIRIANFQARTTEDLLKAVAGLKQENKDGLKGVVLDLRNNPGGVLNSAVGVSDAFLDGGLIVYTKGRVDDSRLEFKAGPDDILAGAPIVVLVNGGSASASEIVAGALQDQGRAIIMGNDTFGKGSVQTIVPIDERTALKLTTARYYTPSGRSIQALGIKPDIKLERGSLTLASEPAVAPVKEANLMRHLDDDPIEEALPQTADDAPLAVEDYQLAEALNVLKGVNIFARPKAPAPDLGDVAVAPLAAAAPTPAPPQSPPAPQADPAPATDPVPQGEPTPATAPTAIP